MTKERIKTGALQIDDNPIGLYVGVLDALQLKGLMLKMYRGEKKINNHDLSLLSRYIAIIELDVRYVEGDNQEEVQRIKTK